MAAASGPVETTSGNTVQMDEFKPPELTASREVAENVGSEDLSDSFKVPELGNTLKSSDLSRKPDTDSVSESEIKSNSKTTSSQQQNKKSVPVLSPAELLKQTQLSIPYKEPIWGGIPPESEKYSFDVLKNGTLIENITLGEKPWIVFGRLPSCDVFMEHPSLSRYHAVIQYRDVPEDDFGRGWYLYDLDSTHGTWVNKVKVKPTVYCRLYVGHVVKFGGSSRLFVLQGPEEDQEQESELCITQLKEQTARLKRENEVLKQAELDEAEEKERERQKILEIRECSWGMGEDATEEPEENPFASVEPEHEHLYVDDPKKALKGFYEREGCDLPDYQFTEVGFGKHKCVVELPVDGPNGEVLVAEATVSGKRKDAVVACALEACRLLDVHGLLHASQHASRKRKTKNWEDEDFYDSDEDTFLDRTGTIEKKRIFRMKKSGKELKAETYESLLPKHQEVEKRIAEIEYKLQQAKAQAEAAANEEDDALEAYMVAIKAGVMDTKTRLSLKRELLTLRTEEQRLRKLVNLAKPAALPELKNSNSGQKKQAAGAGVSFAVRKIGVTKGHKKPLLPSKVEPVAIPDADVEEEDDEEDEPADGTLSTAVPDSKAATPQIQQTTDSSSDSLTFPNHSRHELVSKTGNGSRTLDSGKPSAVIETSFAETSNKIKTVKGLQAKGPLLPSDKNTSQMRKSSAEKLSENAKSSGFSVQRPGPLPMKRKKLSTQKADYDASDPNYAMWLPPENQSGDGRTDLNDKLGY